MKKNKNPKNKFLIKTSLVIFACILIFSLIYYAISILDYKFHILNIFTLSPIISLSILYLFCLGISVILSYFVGKRISKPLNDIKHGISQISAGNFDIEISKTKNKDINEIIDQFNNMAKELKTIETLKSDFISNVSHEFKTPLSVINSYTHALIKNDLNTKTNQEYLNVIKTNVQKLTNMSENILSISKLENQQILLDKQEFLLDEQIRQCIVSLQPEWQKKNIDFDLDLQEIKYLGSCPLFEQVWQNLIYNAIKFSNTNSTITISLKKDAQNIIAKITDTGIGMSEETCKHAIDKFYQGDKSHSQIGNGLGLALVKRILDLHNVKIQVNSELQKGSTFTLIF